MSEKSEKIYKIQKLAYNLDAGNFNAAGKLLKDEAAKAAIARTNTDYLPWDDFRKKTWVPSPKEPLWTLIKVFRKFEARKTPILDKDGTHYTFDPHRHTEFLHTVDLELGGQFMGISDFSEGDKRQIIRRNLIEESIASSKLEGANTSREAARRMLREGRKPRDQSEKMIANNHAAMQRIEEQAKNEPMSIDLLLSLHQEVTRGTLANENLEGQLRDTLDKNGRRLKIMPWDETTVTYVVPDREFVEAQLPLFVQFANDEGNSGFIHPLIKAIMLHFWIGLLHPFEDGNGRVARIIFYWYMLKKGYWAFSYLSLSERILRSPGQYAMAYVNSEQDDYDLNYFIQYNVEKLQLARKQFQEYLVRKVRENRQQSMLIRGGLGLNARQTKLLHHLSKDEERHTSLAAYQRNNPEIGYVTASTDLRALVEKGFLIKQRIGRNINYLPTPKTAELFK